MSSYVTAIVAYLIKVILDVYISSDGRQIPLGVYCRASMYEYLDWSRDHGYS